MSQSKENRDITLYVHISKGQSNFITKLRDTKGRNDFAVISSPFVRTLGNDCTERIPAGMNSGISKSNQCRADKTWGEHVERAMLRRDERDPHGGPASCTHPWREGGRGSNFVTSKHTASHRAAPFQISNRIMRTPPVPILRCPSNGNCPARNFALHFLPSTSSRLFRIWTNYTDGGCTWGFRFTAIARARSDMSDFTWGIRELEKLTRPDLVEC